MKKQEFVLHVLARNINVFTNQAALQANIRDMITQAEEIFDLTESIQKEKAPKK